MNSFLALLGMWLTAVLAASATYPPGAGALPGHGPDQTPPVQLWIEDGTDVFYPRDPVDLRFRSAHDAYVAIVHLDTDGNLELLFPGSAVRAERVAGQRTHALGTLTRRPWAGGSPGIGYFYILASPAPLDLGLFRPHGGSWRASFAVRGDPFWALEELTQQLLRDWRVPPLGVDVVSYHVGGRHRFPSYACYDRLGLRDLRAGTAAFYPSCERLRRLLVTYPFYFDTSRYRGDRMVYLREMEDLAPRHGFKEDARPRVPGWPTDRRAVERPVPRGAESVPVRMEPEQARPQEAPSTPARQRPTLERRPATREPERARPAEPPARSPAPPDEAPPARANPPTRSETRPEPRRPDAGDP
jgi:hypothetical protein